MGCLVAKLLQSFGAASLVAASAAQQAEGLAVVRGRAVDRDGKPVAGCAVGVFARGEAFDTAALLAKPIATTDIVGCYRIDGKRDADQIVVVAAARCQVCVLQLDSGSGAERTMIDALMLPGGKLSGRVRDAAGKPLAGALIRVDDPLPTTATNKQPKMSFQSWARTDERGIFEAPGVPRTGLRVTASAPGYPGVSRLAAHDSPLDLTLTATGLVRGRVVDAAGNGVPGLVLSLMTVERRDGGEPVTSDAEGRFATTAPNAFAFRVTAYDTRPPHASFTSELLRGPADDVEVKPDPGARAVVWLTVRCIDAATKAPIDDFHASLSTRGFGDAAMALLYHAEERRRYRGEASFHVAPSWLSHAFVVVDAKGHGFATVAVSAIPDGPLVAELPTECTLVGRVTDPLNGKPAAGAAVRALPSTKFHLLGSGPDPWRFGAVTDREGRYRIGGLAPGDYDVQAYGIDRPSTVGTQVTIAAGAETTLDVALEAPRFLELDLVGEVPPGCLGSIWMEAIPLITGNQRGTAVHRWLPMPQPVPLTGSRTPKLGPVDDRQFHAKLLLPSRDRLSSALTIDLGVAGTDGATKLQLPDLRSTIHRGRVRLPAGVPTERVAVLATRRFEAGEGDRWSRAIAMHEFPFAGCLASDASFVLDAPRGRYVLQLLDLETGIVFHTDRDERTLDADGATAPLEIVPACRWLTIDFVAADGDGPLVVLGIDVRVDRPGAGLKALVGAAGGDDKYQRMLVPCAREPRQLRWLVPSDELALAAVQAFPLLSPTERRYTRDEVDHDVVRSDANEPRVTFRIPPPPAGLRR